MLIRNKLAAAQVVTHLSIPFMLYFAHGWQYLASLGVYFLTGCLGMSMTYHRYLSHRSWKSPRWFEILGTLLASYGLTGTSIAWTAIHRQHHRHSDRSQDPHSPWYYSLWQVQFLSLRPTPRLRFARDLLTDTFHTFLHRHYFTIHGLILTAFLLFYPFGAVYLYLFPAVLLWHGGSSINTIGHKLGYRNFETGDHSHNNAILGFIMWGEGWHNNHHKYPLRSSFKVKPHEFDLAGTLIGLFP